MGIKIFLGKPPAHIESWIKNHINNSGCGDSGCGCGCGDSGSGCGCGVEDLIAMKVSLSDSLLDTLNGNIEIVADNGKYSTRLSRFNTAAYLYTTNLHAYVTNGYVKIQGGDSTSWSTGFGGSNIVITEFMPLSDSGCGCGCGDSGSGCGDSGCGCGCGGSRLPMQISLSDSLHNTIDDKQIEIWADNGEQNLVLNKAIKSGLLWTNNLHARVTNGYVKIEGWDHWDTGFDGSNIVITAFDPKVDSGCGCGCS